MTSRLRLRANLASAFPWRLYGMSRAWARAAALNHRFDKLGQPLPLELFGCGCGLCARQNRTLRQYWEAR
jgi:hypothetical protein